MKFKDRKIAALLALISAVPFLPSGLHKFYLGQPRWGIVYLLLSLTPIPRVASALEGAWYLFQDREEFDQLFNASFTAGSGVSLPLALTKPGMAATEVIQVEPVAEALRQLDALRQEGLISEYEFEQKRRQLLDRMM